VSDLVSALPEPRANPWLVGHAEAQATLLHAMRGGRMHHAWLITGPPGIGKATLAYRFARRLLAGPAADLHRPDLHLDERHQTFRRVAASGHADLLTIERAWDEKRKKLRGEIVIDDVRRVSGFLHLTPAEGGWRVVVLDGAEDLNRNAANALLKVLEEPPARAILLLVCAAPGRLLPTLRSRCRRLRLSPLDDADVATVLARALPSLDPAQRARAARLAEGSPGRAIGLATGAGLSIFETVAEMLARAPQLTAAHAFAAADTLRDDEAFSAFMDLTRATISTAVREAARGRADAATQKLIGNRPLAAWVDVWHALTRLQSETEDLYLDKRQTLVTSFALLAKGPQEQ
jgi:DNA polymerase-3 subunit delta'